MAGERCAYYKATILREYRRPDHGDDDDVGSDRRTEVVSQNERHAPFTVQDETGSVPVDAERAEVDARQVVDRFERNTGGEGLSITLRGATLHIGGSSTIGYRYTESLLPLDAPVYVLGIVQPNGAIGAPEPGGEGHRFVVNHRSEEALGESLGKSALWLGVGGATLVLGLILLVIGVLILVS